MLGLNNGTTPSPDIDKALLGHIAALRVTINSNRGDDADLIELAHQALENLSPDDVLLRSVIAESLGEAYMRRGQMLTARRVFNEVITLSKGKGNIIVTLAAMGGLGISYEHVGDLHQAAAIYQDAIALGIASGSGEQPVPATGLVQMHLAHCCMNGINWMRLSNTLSRASPDVSAGDILRIYWLATVCWR